MDKRPRVIIIGAGFGGLYAAQTLKHKAVDVLLIDRQNYHTFTPLLYQVATCGLEAEEIAYPVRGIFRSGSNIAFMLGEVTGIDHGAKSRLGAHQWHSPTRSLRLSDRRGGQRDQLLRQPGDRARFV